MSRPNAVMQYSIIILQRHFHDYFRWHILNENDMELVDYHWAPELHRVEAIHTYIHTCMYMCHPLAPHCFSYNYREKLCDVLFREQDDVLDIFWLPYMRFLFCSSTVRINNYRTRLYEIPPSNWFPDVRWLMIGSYLC